MTGIALKMVSAVAEALWGAAIAGSILGADSVDGISSQAMQQGGLGLILTALIISAPPMAAFFFQGTLGSFVPYAQMGAASGGVGAASPGPQGQPPGSYNGGAHAAQQPERVAAARGKGLDSKGSRIAGAGTSPVAEGTGARGAAALATS